MGANADRFAANARPDKVRFMLRDADPGTTGPDYYASVLATVCDATGWSEEYARRHVKYQVTERKGQRTGAILQLTWRACEACYTLDLSWMARVIEVEMKAYLNEQENGSFGAFIETLQNSTGRLNTYIYSNGAHASAKKGAKQKSATLGSKKSEQNVKVYKRQGERAGMETAVRGKKVRAVANATLEIGKYMADGVDVGRVWNAFFARCARLGFISTANELSRRGIDLSDFFSDFTAIAEESKDIPSDESTYILGSRGEGFTGL